MLHASPFLSQSCIQYFPWRTVDVQPEGRVDPIMHHGECDMLCMELFEGEASSTALPLAVFSCDIYLHIHPCEGTQREVPSASNTFIGSAGQDSFRMRQFTQPCCATLLQEMYFRHLYAVTQPSLQQRVESWQNYQALFNVILRGNVNMQV